MNSMQGSVWNSADNDFIDDDFDPMRDEYFNPNINCYDHGPGANMDTSLQVPAYRDKNNQVVYKVMVNRIPKSMTKDGLENLFLNFGTPNISKFSSQNGWALVEFKLLKEAEESLKLDSMPPYNMRVSFAKSDEENEKLKRKKQDDEKFFSNLNASVSNKSVSPPIPLDSSHSNRNLLKMLGRGQNRGRLLIRAYRDNCERKAGSRTCVWSNGDRDIRDPGNLMYDSRSCRHEGSNRYLKNIVVQTSANSVRKVAMGRGYIPPVDSATSHPSAIKTIGKDVCVPMLPCVKCNTETTMKCGKCGTPYCSKQCQIDDFVSHRQHCEFKMSIDVTSNDNTRVGPLTQTNEKENAAFCIEEFQSIMCCHKPERNVLSLLKEGSDGVFIRQAGSNDGVLSCREALKTAETLLDLPLKVSQCADAPFWPPVGAMVALRWDGSVWRGYILNAPTAGSSEPYTVAMCDIGRIERIAACDVLRLPSDYYDLPELAVSCKFKDSTLSPQEVGEEQMMVRVLSVSAHKVSAEILSPDNSGKIVGLVELFPWMPSNPTSLIPTCLIPPCQVIISSYHHQHALYVRPIGKQFQDQFFTLLQHVAAVHVTSPPLGRPPFRNEMVACRFSKDNNYYRAVVCGESETSSQEYSVYFVDFGNKESVPVNAMKALPDDLKKFPCMAVKISLKGVLNGPLTEDAVQFLNIMVQKEQQLLLECPPGSDGGVELFLPNKKSFNAELNELLTPEWKISLKNGLGPYKGKIFMLEDLSTLPLLKEKLKCGSVEVFIMSILLDGRLAVCPVDRPEIEHVIQTLFVQVNEYCESTDPNDRYNPRQNEVCLAKFKDGMWYRAVNLDTETETQKCQVIFLDYGNVEVVDFKDIRRMVPDFMTTPSLISFCCVNGFPDQPTEHMVKRLHELVPTSRVFDVQVLDVVGEGEYKICIPEVSNQLKAEFGS